MTTPLAPSRPAPAPAARWPACPTARSHHLSALSRRRHRRRPRGGAGRGGGRAGGLLRAGTAPGGHGHRAPCGASGRRPGLPGRHRRRWRRSETAERVAGALRGPVAVLPAWETLPFERVSPEVETMGRRLAVLRRPALRRGAGRPGAARRPRGSWWPRSGPCSSDSDRPRQPRPWSSARETRSTSDCCWPSWSPAATGGSTRSSTAASSPCAAASSTCSPPPPTCPVRIDLWGDEVDRLTAFVGQRPAFVGRPRCCRALRGQGDRAHRGAAAGRRALVARAALGRLGVGAPGPGEQFDGMESWLPFVDQTTGVLPDLLPPGLRWYWSSRGASGTGRSSCSTRRPLWPRRWRPPGAPATGGRRTIIPAPARPFRPPVTRLPLLRVAAAAAGPRGAAGAGARHATLRTRRRRPRAPGGGRVAPGGRGLHGHAVCRHRARGDPSVRPGWAGKASTPPCATAATGRRVPRGRRRRWCAGSSCPSQRWRCSRRPTSPAVGCRTAGPARALVPPTASSTTSTTGTFVVHRQHGVARFEGVTTRTMGGTTRDYLILQYRGSDRLYLPVDQIEAITPYSGGESPDALEDGRGGLAADEGPGTGRRRRGGRRAGRSSTGAGWPPWAAPSAPTPPGRPRWSLAFGYVETEDQLAAIADVKGDMEEPRPMDRLVCGDVGFGKTEVAVRAVFKAVQDGAQAAVLVPTTLLASQHAQTFADRFAALPGPGGDAQPVPLPGAAAGGGAGPGRRHGRRGGRHPPAAGPGRAVQGPGPPRGRRGAALRGHPQGGGQAAGRGCRRADADRQPHPAHPGDGPDRHPGPLHGQHAAGRPTPHPHLRGRAGPRGRQRGAPARAAARGPGLLRAQPGLRHRPGRPRPRALVPEARVAVAHGQMDEGSLETVVLDFWERQLRRTGLHDHHRVGHRHALGQHADRRPGRPVGARAAAPDPGSGGPRRPAGLRLPVPPG